MSDASNRRVLVALSGGVDSSVAAALLLERGHTLVGVTLHLWDAEGDAKVGRCCAPEDREDARRTADALGFPHFVIDERAAFRETVVDPFVAAYRDGRTPSPCTACNQHVKLGRLAALADSFGCDAIATGHYARLGFDRDGTPSLRRGRDHAKDQSYFLHGVPPSILARMLLPLGELEKRETRREGARLGVPNFAKKDSQELCFVPDGDVAGFVDRELRARGEAPIPRGTMRDPSGALIAAHPGVHHYTIGQRRGLGLGGGPPRYVLRIVPETADVIVGPAQALGAEGLEVEEASWIVRERREPFEALLQVRHHHRPARALVTPRGRGFVARFHEPERAVAAGQAAVVYDDDRVLCGGVISRVTPGAPTDDRVSPSP